MWTNWRKKIKTKQTDTLFLLVYPTKCLCPLCLILSPDIWYQLHFQLCAGASLFIWYIKRAYQIVIFIRLKKEFASKTLVLQIKFGCSSSIQWKCFWSTAFQRAQGIFVFFRSVNTEDRAQYGFVCPRQTWKEIKHFFPVCQVFLSSLQREQEAKWSEIKRREQWGFLLECVELLWKLPGFGSLGRRKGNVSALEMCVWGIYFQADVYLLYIYEWGRSRMIHVGPGPSNKVILSKILLNKLQTSCVFEGIHSNLPEGLEGLWSISSLRAYGPSSCEEVFRHLLKL